MKKDQWEHAEKDAVQAENMAATAWENGNVIAYTYWMKRADEHRKVARKVSKVLTLPAFLRGAPREPREMIDITPDDGTDLEVLAKTIDIMRSRKVIADGDLIRAEGRAKEAEDDLNAAVDAYEEEVRKRGLLCRK
jgi:hypothetical protein